MFLRLVRLLFGLFCGYFVVSLFPNLIPFHPEEFFAGLVLRPLNFLAGAMAIVLGMFLMGGLLRNGAAAILMMAKGRQGSVQDLFFALCCFGCFFLLAPLGIWQTAVFFSFSLVYGMISFVPVRAQSSE